MVKNCLVSVVVPIYNAQKYLEECIDSLIAQTIFESLEVLLVDDGSTDSSPEICEEYSHKHENIKVLHQQNMGVSGARNTGIENANCKYVGFVDSDDYVYPEMYENLYELAQKTSADITVCGFKHIYPDKDVTIEYPFNKGKFLDGEYVREKVCPFMLSDSSLNSVCNKIFKRDVLIQESIRMNTEKKQGEDREFLLKTMQKSNGMAFTSYVGYYYRYNETSAIQKPRHDYVDTILNQYFDDFELFGAFRMTMEEIKEINDISAMKQIICALSFSVNKMSGKSRRQQLKSIMCNEQVRALMNSSWQRQMENNSKFNIMILKMIKRKSVVGVLFITGAMKAKVSLYNILNKK